MINADNVKQQQTKMLWHSYHKQTKMKYCYKVDSEEMWLYNNLFWFAVCNQKTGK